MLEEDRYRKSRSEMTRLQRAALITIRVVVNVLVLGILIGSGVAVVNVQPFLAEQQVPNMLHFMIVSDS